MPRAIQALHYLRVSIARWNIDTYSPEAERIFHEIETAGVAVSRSRRTLARLSPAPRSGGSQPTVRRSRPETSRACCLGYQRLDFMEAR